MKKIFINFPANRAPKIQSRRFGHQSFVNTAYKTDGEPTEVKAADILKELNTIKEGLETKAKEDAKAEVAEQLKTVNEAIEELKNAKPEVTADELKAIKSEVETAVKALNILNVRVKGQANSQLEVKSVRTFNEILAETIERNLNDIKSHRKGSGERNFDMLPEVKAKDPEDKREVKAVGDMSIAANFTGASNYLVERRPMTDLIQNPYNRVWLSDILPGGNSTAPSVLYPKENGGEGAAALWEDPAVDKAQMDFDLTSTQAFFKWIAGIAIIDREMLDDIPFMISYIQSKMLISLKTAENSFILNGSDPTGTNPVSGLMDVATAYNGDYTKPVDKIIDAAWGQIVEDTNEFYNPTTLVMMPRAAVQIGLNKADGSGEYDLPNGTVAFSQGNLSLAALENVRTTAIGANNFLAMDKNAVMYIRRMAPELRLFEDATLAKKNKLMFRIEGRSTLAIFNNAAIVKGTLV